MENYRLRWRRTPEDEWVTSAVAYDATTAVTALAQRAEKIPNAALSDDGRRIGDAAGTTLADIIDVGPLLP